MRFLRPLSLAALGAAAACSDSTGPGSGAAVPTGLVVLNASQNTGLTLRSLTASDSTFIPFTPSSAYDGGAITLGIDTVLSTSSKGAGDQLWVAALDTRLVRRFQLPSLSNPAGVAFVSNRSEGRVAVALRDSQAVAIVDITPDAPKVTLVRNAGTCPVDVAERGFALYVVDANANCRSDYSVVGAARVIRIRSTTTVRDTITLPTAQRGSGASITLDNDIAYVATGGEADFSDYPNTRFTTPGMISRIDLTTRTVTASRALPAGTYGAGLKLGRDGKLYVTAYTSTSFATQGVFTLDPTTLAFAGPFAAGTQQRQLTKTGGAAANCGTATADEQGNVYCLETDYTQAGATTVQVFDAAGAFVRALQAGQYGADLVLR